MPFIEEILNRFLENHPDKNDETSKFQMIANAKDNLINVIKGKTEQEKKAQRKKEEKIFFIDNTAREFSLKKQFVIIALMDNPYVQRVQSDVIIKIISKIKKIGD